MTENKKVHRALIEFLKQFEPYKDSKVLIEERKVNELTSLDTNDINKSVFLICDFLNYPSGSTDNVQLYRLLQTYFLDEEKRNEINKIIGH